MVKLRHSLGRRDKSEAEVIAAFKSQGASVSQLSGSGIPDLVVGKNGVNILVEVKSGKRGLNKEQRFWHNQWRGQVAVVRSAEEALLLLARVCRIAS